MPLLNLPSLLSTQNLFTLKEKTFSLETQKEPYKSKKKGGDEFLKIDILEINIYHLVTSLLMWLSQRGEQKNMAKSQAIFAYPAAIIAREWKP